MRILFVAGYWDEDGGRPSGLSGKMFDAMSSIVGEDVDVTFKNGGWYLDLNGILDRAPDYDIVMWFADVPNDLPKVRDVKAVAPRALFVNSKRNDGGKYSFQEIVQRSLSLKANMTFEFSKQVDGLFSIRVVDPLGCLWYEGTDVGSAMGSALSRLRFLMSVTRQGTSQASWNRDALVSSAVSGSSEDSAEAREFLELVRSYAEQFHELLHPADGVKRFLGNCSMNPSRPFRCSKGMPSFKHAGWVFMSRRNVDKQSIDPSQLVPARLDGSKVIYCGDSKPSVDTPIQLRLYDALPNIRYMIHSHCYLADGSFTSNPIPCGALEEVDEVLSTIDGAYGSRDLDLYKVNLVGHGSIAMAGSVSQLHDLEYYGRDLPEAMFTF